MARDFEWSPSVLYFCPGCGAFNGQGYTAWGSCQGDPAPCVVCGHEMPRKAKMNDWDEQRSMPNHNGGWDDGYDGLLGTKHPDAKVGNFCVILPVEKVHLKGPCRIDPFAVITCGLVMEGQNHVASHAYMNGGPEQTVFMERWAFCGSGVRLVTGSDDYKGDYGPIGPHGKNRMDRGDIRFGEYSGVAVGCTVLPGVTLSEGACVAAHGFVRPWVYEPWTVYACVPGKEPKVLFRRNEAKVKELGKEWSK